MRSTLLSLVLAFAATAPALAGGCTVFTSPSGTTIALDAPEAGKATISLNGNDLVCDLQAARPDGATEWPAIFFCGEVSQAAMIVATSADDPTPAKLLYRGAEMAPDCDAAADASN